MFDTTKEKVDFAYCAAQAYIETENRDSMINCMREKYPDTSIEVFETAWRCIDAFSDLTE